MMPRMYFVCCVVRTRSVATVEDDMNRLKAILNKLVSTVLHVGRNSYFHSNTDLRRYLFYHIFVLGRQLHSLPYFLPHKTHFSPLPENSCVLTPDSQNRPLTLLTPS